MKERVYQVLLPDGSQVSCRSNSGDQVICRALVDTDCMIREYEEGESHTNRWFDFTNDNTGATSYALSNLALRAQVQKLTLERDAMTNLTITPYQAENLAKVLSHNFSNGALADLHLDLVLKELAKQLKCNPHLLKPVPLTVKIWDDEPDNPVLHTKK
ncbi:hypothetical protein [Pseudomonas serbica]|uniref:hypothetical protein n=1 Tax=Pseudomonas serbica TaxID=2965074 RepID=UPI00237A58C9|nr:hypothetical protein [Pseudomonas serbica]